MLVAEDPYCYPGTESLRNRRGIRDLGRLQRFETRATFGRLRELEERPIAGDFDRAHLQAIHRHLFQDVYPWAGELRDVDIAKPGSPFFARPPFIAPALDELAAKMRAESHLQGLDRDDFALRAGHYLGEINAVHPFREGNGRAQREFVRELGVPLDELLAVPAATIASKAAPAPKRSKRSRRGHQEHVWLRRIALGPSETLNRASSAMRVSQQTHKRRRCNSTRCTRPAAPLFTKIRFQARCDRVPASIAPWSISTPATPSWFGALIALGDRCAACSMFPKCYVSATSRCAR